MNRSHRRPYGFLIALIVVVPIILFSVHRTRILVERGNSFTERANAFKQLGLGLHNFHSTYGRFPMAVHRDQAGNPLSSWRFHILPFVEAIMRDWDYSARWDDPVNAWLTSQPHSVYCSSASRQEPASVHTNVVAITGPGTVFDGDREVSIDDIDSDTILAIEVAASGIHWAAPGDLSIHEVTPLILSGLDGQGVHVLFADAVVWHIRNDADFDDFKKFFTIDGAKKFDRETVLRHHTISTRR